MPDALDASFADASGIGEADRGNPLENLTSNHKTFQLNK
jgi:hypothetical protein